MNTHVPSGSGVGHASPEVGVDVGVQVDVAGVSHDRDQQSSLSRMVWFTSVNKDKKRHKSKDQKNELEKAFLSPG